MPSLQSKINVEARQPADEENVKARGHLKAKNKDRTSNRKTESTWDRLSQWKRKKDIVPELDLKPISPRNKKTLSRDDSARRSKNMSARTAAARLAKKRQWDVGNAYSKSNFNVLQNKLMGQHDAFLDECKSSRSLFYFSPRPSSSLMDVENINPNQTSDNFFECNELDDFFRTQFPDFENTTEYNYQNPKGFEDFDVPSPTSEKCCKNKNPEGLKHFKELLQQVESSSTNLLQQHEIALLKNIVKADERHQKLRRDDYDLLKEILTGQLKEITQQERVIKMALKKIRSRTDDEVEVTTIKGDAAEQPMEDRLPTSKPEKPSSSRSHSARCHSAKCETPKQEVDIIFKNVPSLEKEIRILRSLGLKLEETLKRSSVRKLTARGNQPPLIVHTNQLIYFRHCVCIVSFIVVATASKVVTEVAQEYQIRYQTLDELKLEREFFIPTELADCRFALQRTNFHKLSRNPELLLRRLKPFTKDDEIKFNFIEQNPMFFNHFLAKMCTICSNPVEGYGTYIPQNFKQRSDQKLIFVKSGAGDHPDYPFKNDKPQNLEPVVKDKPSSSSSLDKKKKKKHCATPVLDEKLVTPKNSLLRNILVAIIQLSILSMVVAAILYPDLICL